MKNINWLHRIVFAISSGLLFGLILYLFNLILDNKEQSLNSLVFETVFFGIFFGLGFPFIINIITPKLASKIKSPKINGNENIIHKGGANFFNGKWIATGGKLFLTNKSLIFNSHKYNFKNGETIIDLNTIKEVSLRKTLKIINNGLRITTKDNYKYDFVVNNPNMWIEKLKHSVSNTL